MAFDLTQQRAFTALIKALALQQPAADLSAKKFTALFVAKS